MGEGREDREDEEKMEDNKIEETERGKVRMRSGKRGKDR